MEITDDTLRHIAHLARLEFPASEAEEIRKDLNRMLDFVETMNGLSTDGVEPLIYMTDEVNVLRKDKVLQEITHEEALSNAPKRDSDFFRVPKVIKQD